MKATFPGSGVNLSPLTMAADGFNHRGFLSFAHLKLKDIKTTLVCFLYLSNFANTVGPITSWRPGSHPIFAATFKSPHIQFYSSIINFHVLTTLKSLLANFLFQWSILVKRYNGLSLGDKETTGFHVLLSVHKVSDRILSDPSPTGFESGDMTDTGHNAYLLCT